MSWTQRDVEPVETKSKAFAERLDERFLARPAIEESERVLGRVQAEVSLAFFFGEKTLRYAVRIRERMDRLDIDADLASPRKAEHGGSSTVPEVEAQPRVTQVGASRACPASTPTLRASEARHREAGRLIRAKRITPG
jgi:hypothetical protein